MKVAHLTSVDLGALFLMPQLEAVLQEGHECHIICGDGPNVPMFRQKGFTVHLLTMTRDINPLEDLKLLKFLRKLFKKEQYDILHAHTAKLEFFGQVAARQAKVPIVLYTNHGFIFRSDMSTMKKKLIMTLARYSGKISDRVLSQAMEDVKVGVEMGVYKEGKIQYLGNGIDLTPFNIDNYTEQDIVRIKESTAVPTDKKIVGMVGRFVWEKGFRELFEAAGIILSQEPATHFVIIGNKLDSERDPVDFDLLEKMDIAENFTILTGRSDMPDLYAIMDVVTLPSYREGFPRTMMEGAAMSKALVASDISGCREAVENGFNGYLVPVKTVQPLAEAILKLLENDTLRKEMGEKGRMKAEEQFDQNKVVERLLDTYDELVQEKMGHTFRKKATSHVS